jgi:serine/threonine protein kinase/WD40 repeat protein
VSEPDTPRGESPSADEALADLVEQLTNRLQAGEPVDAEEVLRQHPRLADQLRRLLPTLQAFAALGPAHPAGSPPPGRRLGDFRVVREVGRGGMGVVYEAVQESLGRRVALKVLPSQAWADEVQRERFRREAQAAARLHHSNIIPVHGVGEHDGVLYYAMQFIAGEGLDALLRRLRRPAGASPPDPDDVSTLNFLRGPGDTPEPDAAGRTPAEARRPAVDYRRVAGLGACVADALHYAHTQGVLHRDVKPSNLLLDESGVVWVTDFGLARVQSQEGLTGTGDVVGTPRYMPPERFRGVSDERGDVYGLGLTLYELLTRTAAFEDTDPARQIERVLREQPPRPRSVDPHIPADLEVIVLKTIDKDPRHRYPTAAALRDDLRRFLEDRPILARRAGPLGHVSRWARRNPVPAALGGVISGLVLALAVGASVSAVWLEAAYQEATEQKGNALTNLAVAEGAQREVKEQLRRSLFVQAQVQRWSGRAGHRTEALDALERSAALAGELGLPPSLELRNEAIAALALPDLAVSREWAVESPPVTAAAAAPDLARFAYGSGGGEVRLVAPGGGSETALRPAFGHPITFLGFSPDGRHLAAAARAANELRVWNVTTGTCWLKAALPEDATAVDFSPDSRSVAVGVMPGGRPAVVCYEADSARVARTIPLTRPAWSVAWHPDGEQIAVGVKPNGVMVLGPDGKLVRGFTTSTEVRALAWRPDGRHLAAGSLTGLFVCDVVLGRQYAVLGTQLGVAQAVAYGPGGDVLVSVHSHSTALWQPPQERPLVISPWQGMGLRFSPDGRRLGAALRSDRLGTWDVERGPAVAPLVSHAVASLGGPAATHRGCLGVSFSHDGRLLLTSGANGAHVWDARRGTYLVALPPACAAGAFHPAEARLVTHGKGGVCLWPVEAEPGGYRIGPPRPLGVATAPWPDPPSWERTGRFVVVRDGLRKALVVDPSRPEAAVALRGELGNGPSAVSPDGRYVVTGSEPYGKILVWDSGTGELVRQLPGGDNCRAAFSPDGRRLTVGLEDGYQTWRTDDWQSVRAVSQEVPSGGTAPVAYSPDGRVMARVLRLDRAQLCDPESGREWATLEGPASYPIATLWFSPDGSRLVAANPTEPAQIWDLRAVRRHLARIGHDWDLPPFRDDAEADPAPLTVRVVDAPKP